VSVVWGVLGVVFWFWVVFLVCFLFCLVLYGYCSATVLFEGLVGVVSGCFSGSFRCGEVFSGSDDDPPPPLFLNGVFGLLFVGGVVDPVIRCIFS
jgi:hypothetical protein